MEFHEPNVLSLLLDLFVQVILVEPDSDKCAGQHESDYTNLKNSSEREKQELLFSEQNSLKRQDEYVLVTETSGHHHLPEPSG